LADANLYTRNFARFTELTAKTEALRAEKDAAEERWLELAEMVDAFAG
jgi:ABC transport system ATP-binding/permease protein